MQGCGWESYLVSRIRGWKIALDGWEFIDWMYGIFINWMSGILKGLWKF